MNSFILTDSAKNQAVKLQTSQPEWNNLPLRVYLAGKGCDGFDYGVCFTDEISPDDHQEFHENLKIICDQNTLSIVKGSTIDWVNDERGQGFLVTNPRHGLFKGKFYKRKSWQERAEKAFSAIFEKASE